MGQATHDDVRDNGLTIVQLGIVTRWGWVHEFTLNCVEHGLLRALVSTVPWYRTSESQSSTSPIGAMVKQTISCVALRCERLSN